MTAAPERGFDAATSPHRRELHVHCYRMLASFDDAEDAVQDTYLRAWRAWDSFDGQHPRAWLYRIATNVCTDLLRARKRRAPERPADIAWLTPYPDRLLDEIPADDDGPDEVAVAKETIELAFLAALQVLPARQRAALLAREVLGMPAAETAQLLETSVAAANSALQRARSTMQQNLATRRTEWSAPPLGAQDKELLEKFIDAHERGDAVAAVAVAAQDIRITMPPYPFLYEGIDAMRSLMDRAFGSGQEGDWRLLPTSANRMPAAGSYLRRWGDTRFRPYKIDVLRTSNGVIAEVTTFGPALFPAFGLPDVL